MDRLFSVAFDDENLTPTIFGDPQIKAFGACVTTVNIILSLLACSITSVDKEECMTEKLINTRVFKRAFASIKSTPKYLFTCDCAILCKCHNFCKSYVHFTCNN